MAYYRILSSGESEKIAFFYLRVSIDSSSLLSQSLSLSRAFSHSLLSRYFLVLNKIFPLKAIDFTQVPPG